MKAVLRRATCLLLATTLAGCATGGGGGDGRPVEVTRFHLTQPIARGEIAVEPFELADADRLEFRTYGDAVARQLARHGWPLARAGGLSEQVALVDVTQGNSADLPRRSPVSVGVGGSTGGWGSGVGVGVGVNLGGRRSSELVTTMLEVRIKRRSDATVFWEGRASTTSRAGSTAAQPAVVVERLADALFRDFPGESGRTIRVR